MHESWLILYIYYVNIYFSNVYYSLVFSCSWHCILFNEYMYCICEAQIKGIHLWSVPLLSALVSENISNLRSIQWPNSFLHSALSETPTDATTQAPTSSSEPSQPVTDSGRSTPTPIPTAAPPTDQPTTETADAVEVVHVVMNNMENYLPTDVEDDAR